MHHPSPFGPSTSPCTPPLIPQLLNTKTTPHSHHLAINEPHTHKLHWAGLVSWLLRQQRFHNLGQAADLMRRQRCHPQAALPRKAVLCALLAADLRNACVSI
jgi:hypothetical protein